MSERTFNVNLGSRGIVQVKESDVRDINLDEEEIYLGGERLTEARAEGIAREISRQHGLRGGRPKLPADERASVQKAVRLTPGLSRRLSERAKAKGVRESEILRDALEAYLAAS